MKNILVAGGAGFIGSHLCDALLANGNHVVCLDNFLRGSKDNLKSALLSPDFCLISGDASDTSLVSRILKEHEISHVFHLAANSDIQASAKDPRIEFSMTLLPTWSILCAMRETGVRKMFFASTSAIYGDRCGVPLKESDPAAPISYYGAAKTGSEALISAFSQFTVYALRRLFLLDFNNIVNLSGARLALQFGVHYNITGAISFLMLVLCLFFLLHRNKLLKIISALLIPIHLFVCHFSNSRTIFVTGLVILPLFIFFYIRITLKTKARASGSWQV